MDKLLPGIDAKSLHDRQFHSGLKFALVAILRLQIAEVEMIWIRSTTAFGMLIQPIVELLLRHHGSIIASLGAASEFHTKIGFAFFLAGLTYEKEDIAVIHDKSARKARMPKSNLCNNARI